MGKYTTITSPTQLDTLLLSNTYVLLDFWATWCPPCRAIAPVFERLASENTIPNSLAFAKVDVDAQGAIAQKYGITAMPTFLLVKDGQVINSVKGANPQGIKTLVTHALQQIEKAKKDKKVEEEEEEEKDETTVSGSYTMSSNSNWKMSL